MLAIASIRRYNQLDWDYMTWNISSWCIHMYIGLCIYTKFEGIDFLFLLKVDRTLLCLHQPTFAKLYKQFLYKRFQRRDTVKLNGG